MTVNLVDVNDNGPEFVDSNNVQVYVAEDRPINTTIYTLSTVDVDSVSNSNTGYQIVQSNVSSLFSINELGQLLLNGMLDRESATTQYQLTVMAYDIEIPSMNNSINITVNVLDSNDHNPIFTEPFYDIVISEVRMSMCMCVCMCACLYIIMYIHTCVPYSRFLMQGAIFPFFTRQSNLVKIGSHRMNIKPVHYSTIGTC